LEKKAPVLTASSGPACNYVCAAAFLLSLQVFNQSSAVQEDAGWRDNLYRMYTTSSANMRVAVYGSKHDAANYEELLRKFCAVTELVRVCDCVCMCVQRQPGHLAWYHI
jgi:hypothetical protein